MYINPILCYILLHWFKKSTYAECSRLSSGNNFAADLYESCITTRMKWQTRILRKYANWEEETQKQISYKRVGKKSPAQTMPLALRMPAIRQNGLCKIRYHWSFTELVWKFRDPELLEDLNPISSWTLSSWKIKSTIDVGEGLKCHHQSRDSEKKKTTEGKIFSRSSGNELYLKSQQNYTLPVQICGVWSR